MPAPILPLPPLFASAWATRSAVPLPQPDRPVLDSRVTRGLSTQTAILLPLAILEQLLGQFASLLVTTARPDQAQSLCVTDSQLPYYLAPSQVSLRSDTMKPRMAVRRHPPAYTSCSRAPLLPCVCPGGVFPRPVDGPMKEQVYSMLAIPPLCSTGWHLGSQGHGLQASPTSNHTHPHTSQRPVLLVSLSPTRQVRLVVSPPDAPPPSRPPP